MDGSKTISNLDNSNNKVITYFLAGSGPKMSEIELQGRKQRKGKGNKLKSLTVATCTLTQEAIAIVRSVHTTSIKITKRNVGEADFYALLFTSVKIQS